METVGSRVRTVRKRRGISQEMLAGLAGVSQSFISKLEGGSKTVERRSTLAAIARALQVSASELVAGEPGDPTRDAAAVAVPAIREALIMREAGEQGQPLRVDAHRRAQELGAASDYGTLAPMLPSLLSGCDGEAFVYVCYETTFCLKYLGYSDLARDAAALALGAAQDTDRPELVAVAEFMRTHALPAETAALAARVAAHAADQVQPHTGQAQAAREAYGMLHLTAGLRTAAAKQADQARRHLAEAAAEAEALGEPAGVGFAWMGFSPTNVGTWQMIIGNELGDPDETLRAAERTDPRKLPTPRRQAGYHSEHGRALVAVGRDAEAIQVFLRAESAAPQQVRLDQNVRNAAAAIRKRARDQAITPQLRRLLVALEVV